MKKILFIIMGIFLIFINCKKETKKENIRIVTTIFPLYDFAKNIGKEKINVEMIIPPGIEVHSFEPTPQDIVKINESDLFIYLSEDMEPWVEKFSKSFSESKGNKKLVIFEASKNINFSPIEHKEDENHKEDEHKEHHKEENNKHKENKETHNSENDHHSEETHHHSGKDPHIWLDFEIAQQLVNQIANKLAEIDPDNKEFYLNNAKEYNTKLKELDENYRKTIEKCSLKTILYGGHFAFGYLARRYGITHISPYEGFSPNSEPTPQKIAQLIDKIKKEKIEYLFYEELIDPKVAKAISQSTGIKLELLHAAHNVSKEELEKNVSFLEIMENNLKKLKIGLKYRE